MLHLLQGANQVKHWHSAPLPHKAAQRVCCRAAFTVSQRPSWSCLVGHLVLRPLPCRAAEQAGDLLEEDSAFAARLQALKLEARARRQVCFTKLL